MAKYKIIPSSMTIVQSPISIGHKAEKGVEAIEFDVTAWVETYGSGTLTVIMRRWGDAIPYPIALEIDENNKATWTLSDIDTAKAGMAYAQLSYVVGDEVVKKSDIYTFRVMDSLTGEGEPPEAYESWLEHLTHLAAEAMAEVLDIEGVATDKTLTIDGGIADAKATGEALAEKVDAADYRELSNRVGRNTIALAEKADRSTTYTKAQVDQMISDVEVETDTTLEVAGAPADAKKVGDELSDIKADLDGLDEKVDSAVGTLTPEIKEALLNCFAHVGWDHGADRTYYDALEEALYADNVTRVEAVLSLGTHEIYNTDNIEALRNFLTVTAYYDDNTHEVVDNYILEGDLSSVGTNTVTVKYGRSRRTTVSVPTVANSTGLLYEWDFTKGLRDLRQGKVAVLQNNESYNPPTLNANGITFDGPQAVKLFDTNEAIGNIIFGKTIQADVASYEPVTTNGNVRFLCFGDDHEQWATQGQVEWADGLIYRNANSYWTIYNGAGWATNSFSGMTARNAVSGHTIGLYINSSGTCKLYVDGTSKGTVSGANLRKSYLYGFRIGDTGPSNSMYNATIRGLRIYNGEVAS